MRFRAVPSIAYRLALVAAGEARAAVSLNGPVGWDYAGGHAILLGAGMDLYDQTGQSVRCETLASKAAVPLRMPDLVTYATETK
jgi:fructose-1,6-bisphosphatase/inositol monophosphatase family enzyme